MTHTHPQPSVCHIGSAVDAVGGISTVLAQYRSFDIPQRFLSSFRPGAPFWGAEYFVSALAKLVLAVHRDVIVHVHISERGSWIREGALAAVASAFGHPTVITIHGGLFPEYAMTHHRRVRRVLRRADAIIVINSDAVEAVQRAVPAVPVTLVFNPVSAGAPVRPAANAPVAVYAGEISRAKGIDTLVRAWAAVARRLPSARLLLAGPLVDVEVGPQTGAEYVGVLPDARAVRRIVEQARVGVFPSTCDSFGMFLAEAMAAGVPVVASRRGAATTLLDEGRGRTVPVGDDVALAAAILAYLEDADKADADGRRAREFAIAHLDPENVATQLRSVYGLVEAPRARRNDRIECAA